MYYHGFKMHGLINDLFLPGLWSVCSCSDLAEVITGWVGHEHRAANFRGSPLFQATHNDTTENS